jgi:hypothetical protein
MDEGTHPPEETPLMRPAAPTEGRKEKDMPYTEFALFLREYILQ